MTATHSLDTYVQQWAIDLDEAQKTGTAFFDIPFDSGCRTRRSIILFPSPRILLFVLAFCLECFTGGTRGEKNFDLRGTRAT